MPLFWQYNFYLGVKMPEIKKRVDGKMKIVEILGKCGRIELANLASLLLPNQSSRMPIEGGAKNGK
jgi:hypothetical protein